MLGVRIKKNIYLFKYLPEPQYIEQQWKNRKKKGKQKKIY